MPDMPDRGDAGYVVDLLWEVGPTMSGGMGEGPLTHGELYAYQQNTGIQLSEWEATTLRRLSLEYMNESHRATKRDCPAPWQSEEYEDAMRVAVGNDLESQMLNLMG